MTHETQKDTAQTAPHLTEIERYVLDMGNRFSGAVRTDATYTRLQDAATALDYDIIQLSGYQSEHDKVVELEKQRSEMGAQFQARKLLLVELWEEAHGNEGVFTRLIRLEDLRAQLEADPERTELLDEYRHVKEDLDAFRYSAEGSHSVSG